jgi:hypothetical protein
VLKTKIDFSNIKALEEGLSASNQEYPLLDLTEKQKARIRRTLSDEIEAWESDAGELQDKLKHWYDLSEGIIDETDEPYPNAYQTHIDLIGIYLKVYASIEKRSILGPETLWFSETDPEHDELQDQLPDIDNMMNYKARAEWNIAESIGEVMPLANRDGLGILKIPHVEQTEEVEDKIILTSESDFFVEFPGPADAGLSRTDWETLHQLVLEKASEETPIEVPIEYERINYFGPKAYIVERANFVTFPANARSLDKEYCRGIGDRFYIRREEVRDKMDKGEWYKDACKEFLRKTKKNPPEGSEYRTNQESISGINRGDQTDDHEFYETSYWMRIDFKGNEKRYVFIYSKEHNILMFAKMYWYRAKNYYALFRIERRANQIDGKSIVGQLEFINEEIDLLHNMRVQGWQISNIPSFMMETSLNRDLDMDADENLWRPGVVFHLPPGTFDKFRQFDVRATDQGQTMQEERDLFKVAALIMGIDAFLASGRPSPDDPDAPGNKTELLVNQGNIRMEDPISELRYGVEDAGEICMNHLYQFGPAEIEFIGQEGNRNKTKHVSKRLFRTGIRLKMQGVSVVMNSENEFNKWIQRWSIAIREPLIAKNAKYRIEPLRMAFKAGRVPNADRYVPSVEEAEQENIDNAKMAILQLQQEQQQQQAEAAQAQAQAQEEAKRQAIGQLQDKVKVQDLIQRMLENSRNGAEQAA